MEVWNSPSLLDRLVRPVATAIHRLAKRARRRRRPGAHALALTPARKLILVKLRYAPGWRLPGGGRHRSEQLEEAALRELREEIGMTGHGSVRAADSRLPGLLIVEDVRYRPPRWSWEIEAIRESEIDALPDDLSAKTRRWIEVVRDRI